MRINQAEIDGVFIVKIEQHRDPRGYFGRTFCRDTFRSAGLVHDFPQWSVSFNQQRGTIRGLHFQRAPHAETKLVRVTRGAIFDVAVDIRPDSATRGKWVSCELSVENGRLIYIPQGFAHGFQTLMDETDVEYAISTNYAPSFADGYRYDDPAFGIAWPLPLSVIADKDRAWPDFRCL